MLKRVIPEKKKSDFGPRIANSPKIKLMKSRFLSLSVVGLGLFFSGCSFNAGYNPSYISSQPMALGIAGKSLVVLDVGDAAWTYSGSPTSFTGGGTTLTIPMGEITKQIALKVFGAAFKEGAEFRHTAGDVKGYRLVVQPKVSQFNYAYNQLKNLGFAITPQVQIQLRVVMTGPGGKQILEKTYESGLTEGESYMVSGQPAEKVNQIMHITLFKLMTDAAIEAKTVLEKSGAPKPVAFAAESPETDRT